MILSESPIATGLTAEIYAWKDGQVLKLFRQGTSYQTVEYEASLARIVHTSGLPAPAAGAIVEINGRFGLEYQRIDGPSMLEVLSHKPWLYRQLARQLAGLQADMHLRQVEGMPLQHERLKNKINRAGVLSEIVRQAALQALNRLPEQNRLCHGDFHPGNILMAFHGPVIIDWIDASSGNPLLDVGRSALLFGGGPLPPGTPLPGLVRVIRTCFYRAYLDQYFHLNLLDQAQLPTWIAVCAAARLDENIPGDEQRLISIAQSLVSVK